MKLLKRITAALLAVIISFSAIGVYVTAAESLPSNASYVAGDADGDAIINSADALRIIQHTSGHYEMTDVVRKTAADVDKNNNLNSTDALYILYYVVGRKESFPRADYNLQKVAGSIVVDGYTGCVVDSKGLGLVGFAFDAKNNVFYATGQGWQRTMGYTELYDRFAPVGFMPIETIRIKFNYDNKQWMVQLWKGFYGLVLAGCETGFYNRPGDTPEDYDTYNVVSEDYYQEISCEFHYALSSFSRTSKTWWLTGFSPAVQISPSTTIPRMRVENTIRFTDKGLMNAFIQGLEDVDHIFQTYDGKTRSFNFTKGKNYTVSGYTVWFEWQ